MSNYHDCAGRLANYTYKWQEMHLAFHMCICGNGICNLSMEMCVKFCIRNCMTDFLEAKPNRSTRVYFRVALTAHMCWIWKRTGYFIDHDRQLCLSQLKWQYYSSAVMHSREWDEGVSGRNFSPTYSIVEFFRCNMGTFAWCWPLQHDSYQTRWNEGLIWHYRFSALAFPGDLHRDYTSRIHLHNTGIFLNSQTRPGVDPLEFPLRINAWSNL